MSSQAVRTAITAEVTTLAAPWVVLDASDFNSIEDLLQSISESAAVVQYVAADDQVRTIGGQGNQGYEETGTVVVHLFIPTGFASSVAIAKGDAIRTGMRGKRLSSDIHVEDMTPFSDYSRGGEGVNGPVHGFSSVLFYSRHDCG